MQCTETTYIEYRIPIKKTSRTRVQCVVKLSLVLQICNMSQTIKPKASKLEIWLSVQVYSILFLQVIFFIYIAICWFVLVVVLIAVNVGGCMHMQCLFCVYTGSACFWVFHVVCTGSVYYWFLWLYAQTVHIFWFFTVVSTVSAYFQVLMVVCTVSAYTLLFRGCAHRQCIYLGFSSLYEQIVHIFFS